MDLMSDDTPLLLRLALLESLTLGEPHQLVEGSTSGARLTTTQPSLPKSKPTLLLRSHNAQSQFTQSIEKYKPIIQFVKEYKDNKAYLQPTELMRGSNREMTKVNADEEEEGVANDGHEDDRGDSVLPLLSTESIISLLIESESDLKQLHRDLRACENYHERNTAGAGKLAKHESLLPRLADLKKESDIRLKDEMELEERAMQLVEKYSIQVDTISKLFIQWDQILTQTEDALTQLERPIR